MQHPRPSPLPDVHWIPLHLPPLLPTLLASVIALLAALLAASPAAFALETGSHPTELRDLGSGSAVFFARSEEGSELVVDLWRTDGTATGTFALGACQGDCGFLARVLMAAEGRAYFAGNRNGLGGPELWRTDGSPAGTVQLTDLAFNSTLDLLDRSRYHWLAGRDRLLFHHLDGDLGSQLWVSDGERLGTHPILRVPADRRIDVAEGTVAGDRLYFWLHPAGGGTDSALWVSDGTAAGTRELATVTGAGTLATLGDRVLLGRDTGPPECSTEIHIIAGDGPVEPLFVIPGSGCTGHPLRMVPALGLAYVWSPAGGQLHVTDGTVVGSGAITDFAPGGAPPVVYQVLASDDRMFVLADDGVHGAEIWQHSPGEAAARLLADVCPGPCSSVWALRASRGSAVYFSATAAEPPFVASPHVVDASGVRRLAAVCSECGRATHRQVGDYHFFLGQDVERGWELWAIDLDAAQAAPLTDFVEPFPFGTDPEVGSLGSELLFAADDGIHGKEPWRSDGTAAGTRLIADLVASDQTPSGPPATPTGLTLRVGSESGVEVTWDAVAGAQGYELDVRSPRTPRVTLEAGSLAFVTDLLPGTPVTVRVRATNVFGVSPWSDPVSTTIPSRPPGEPCVAGQDELCLRQGRFRVEVDWRDQRSGDTGVGRPVGATGSDRSGTFWFFRPDNVELIVKLLDGTTVNGFWWTFYGALTDVEYWITVTDTGSSETRTYYNPPGRICGRGDTASLSPLRTPAELLLLPPVEPEPFTPAVPQRSRGTELFVARETGATCEPDGTTLCLLDRRFRVRVDWRDQRSGNAGTGDTLPYTGKTGFFTFFNPENVELVVKVLDGRPVNGNFWFFYGALSDVEYTLRVEDLVTGTAKSYFNPPGNICGRADTAGFPGGEPSL